MTKYERVQYMEALATVFGALPNISDADWDRHDDYVARVIGRCPECDSPLDVDADGGLECYACGPLKEACPICGAPLPSPKCLNDLRNDEGV